MSYAPSDSSADRTVAYRLTRPEPTEADIQAAVLHTLALDRRVVWAHRMNSGAAWLPGKGGRYRPVRFGFPGCPDILGQLIDGRVLAIEVKRPSGAATAEQREFLAHVSANGGVAGIVRSVDDVLRLIPAKICPQKRLQQPQRLPQTRVAR